ncbi:histidine kinase [Leptospira selangorensis]|uniref:sensor histidine kinase n=1 Tax=Leptospira selangorensis TaxID=2484982 RepID=UPI0010829617|nr:sensor histidine kinase [Leptospira selangorensis]TGK04448.1 histidine kinase [Leptospira selangorensis]
MEKGKKSGPLDRIFKSIQGYLTPKAPVSSGLSYWRELILTSILFSMTILGTIVYFPSVYLAWTEGKTEVLWVDSLSLGLIYILLLAKRIDFSVKATLILTMNYSLGLSLLIFVGPEGGGLLWLFPFPVLAGVLFGLTPSLFGLLANMIAVFIASRAQFYMSLPWSMAPERLYVVGLNFLIANTIVCVPLTILMRGLQESVQRRHEYLTNLRLRKAHIYRSKRTLEKEIATRIEIERTLEENLREKEVLLHEIHHRVKNNLQIVSGMLNLQNMYSTESSTSEVLSKAQSRITAMAMIHDHLYKQDKFANVDMKTYLDSLLRHLVTSYFPSGNRIGFEADMDPVRLSMEKAIPCGLIVTELISNSLKHAFPNESKGNIFVQLKVKENKVHLTVKDDGVGMPSIQEWFGQTSSKKQDQDSSLGLMIIRSLCNQLKAELDLKNTGGTSVCLIFKT